MIDKTEKQQVVEMGHIDKDRLWKYKRKPITEQRLDDTTPDLKWTVEYARK